MSVNIKELRRLANEATPGPWWTDVDSWSARIVLAGGHDFINGPVCDTRNPLSGEYGSGEKKAFANAAYIAAANPATILALLDELERVKAQSDTYLNLLSEVAYEVESLISESYGVAGLHLNGDVAPWHEIEAGGQYERLTNLPLAIEAARAAKEPQP